MDTEKTMHMQRTLCSGLLAIGAHFLLSGVSQAQDYPARTEIHAIPSLTVSDREFLKGSGGTPVMISGILRLPRGSGTLPTVVLLHGSGGMGANIEYWSRHLNAVGFATLALDGFTARGLAQVSTNQALLGRLNFIVDAYRALEVLSKHSRVDPQRVALMGFSRGGQATLYASLARFHSMWNKSDSQFAAYIPFYPDCATTFMADTELTSKPVRIFHGAPDDYNPIRTCKTYVERLRRAGRDVVLSEFPNAQHAFDNPLGSPSPTLAPNAQTVRACSIEESTDGELLNAATRQPFTYRDECVQSGPHVNHDEDAARQSTEQVITFLKATLRHR